MVTGSIIGLGVPYRFVGDGWDVGPLVLTIALVALLGLARIRLRVPVLAGAALGALIIDHLTDAFGVSIVTAIALLTLVFAIVALARIPAH